MKRALDYGSLTVIGAALLGLVFVLGAPPNSARASRPAAPAFAAFPENAVRTVDLEWNEEAIHQLSRREYTEQVRDWLLMTVLSDAGLSPADLNQTLFDLPPIRYGYLRPVGVFDFDETRARSIGARRVVALIPRLDAGSRVDALARIADESRKNTGETAATILVFEYELTSNGLSATITRRADVAGASLFSEASGYVETTVRGLRDLESFMARIDDLTYARVEPAALRLGGRKVHGHHHHGITIADVAALWSAQTKLHTKNDDFDRLAAAKREAFESRWRGRRYQFEYERIRLENERDADMAKVREELERERKRRGVVAHTGFSLDPSFQYARVREELRGTLGDRLVMRSGGSITTSDVAQAAEEAGRGELDRLYSVLRKLDPQVGRAVIRYLKVNCSYQAARYDGDLQGTEVGMVLFYTDLLAKLWALDFASSAPDARIPEFRSMSHEVLSPIYEREAEVLPSTRLWFGVQPQGFSLQDDGAPSLLLAPVATRLFAASSDSLTPGEEVAPNAASAAFLGWWDDHYAEVARFEPEYERLNEIMKWSIVISWLDDKGGLDLLSLLRQVTFRTDRWFPAWVREHRDLRFQNWDRIGFYPRGFAATEALPLLHSDEAVAMPLMGGVSLAEKEMLATRGAISKEIPEIGRRPTLKWSETTSNLFKTVDGSEFKFAQTAGRYDLDAVVKAGTKFRAPETQVGSLRYSRSLAFEKSAVRMDVRDAGVGIGQLKIERHANNFRVAWQSREGDMATSLARRISTAGEPAAVLAGDARVAASVQTADGEFLVRLRGSSRWLKLAPERAPGADVGQGWHSRVASIDPQAKSINVAWYDDAQVSAALGDRTFVQLPAPSDPSAGVRLQVAARPPPGAQPVTLRLGGHDLNVLRDSGTGTHYARWADIPEEIRRRPELLSRTDRAPSLESSAAGDFPSAAEDLARSPRLYKAALDLHFASELKRVDALLASGDDARALSVLDDLAGIHGNTPDVSLRRAMVLTRHAGPARAARTVEDAMPAPIRNHTALFDEINARIRSAATPAEEQDLRNLAAFGDWTDVAQRNALRTGRPILKAEGGALRLEFRAAQRLDGHRVAELPSGDVPLYVQDAPSLANLDSPAAIQQAVHTGVNGRLPVILKVNHDELAYFRPAKIYVPDGQTAFRRIEAGTRTPSTIAGQAYRAHGNRPCGSEDDRPGCRGSEPSVYLVIDPAGRASLY